MADSGIPSALECVICMGRLRDAHMCPHCSKLSCYECISRWCASDFQTRCPHCRARARRFEYVKCRWVEELTKQILQKDAAMDRLTQQLANSRLIVGNCCCEQAERRKIMSASGHLTDEVFQQGFVANNLTENAVSKREINMKGTKWNIMFDFKYPPYQMEIEITFLESTDNVKFPVPVRAEFSFSVPAHHQIVRYHGVFHEGETTKHRLMIPLEISPMHIRCELRLYPGNHPDVRVPRIAVTKSDFIESLSHLLLKEKFSDVSIVVKGHVIPAHKLVLSAASPVFYALLHDNGENEDIVIDDIDYETMVQVVTCIYTGDAPDLENCAKKVLVAADIYQLDCLKTQCEGIMMRKIDAENACDFLMMGHLYNADQLKEGAKFFITTNFTDVKNTDGFRTLGVLFQHLLLEILECCNGIEVSLVKGKVQKVAVEPDVNI